MAGSGLSLNGTAATPNADGVRLHGEDRRTAFGVSARLST